MSIYGKIMQNAFSQHAGNFGANDRADKLKIDGGEAWNVVRAEERTGREYEIGGQQVEVTQTATGRTDEFNERYTGTRQDYLGKTATMGGNTYRIADIEHGEGFTTISLTGSEEAP